MQPPTNQLNGGNIVQNDTSTYNAGITQVLPWGGGDVTFQFNNNKQVTRTPFANFNPTYTANFNAHLHAAAAARLPIDGTRQQLRVTAINRDISEIQLRGTLATTLANVRNAYWELVFAVAGAWTSPAARWTSPRSWCEDNRARVEVGTMAPLDVVQAEAEAATRRQALAQAEATLAHRGAGAEAADRQRHRRSAVARTHHADRSAGVSARAARRRRRPSRRRSTTRTDLEQARRTHRQQRRHHPVPAEPDAAGPRPHRQLRRAGPRRHAVHPRRAAASAAPVVGTIPGGYSNAWRTLTGRDFPTWNVQLNMSYPLGGSAADAQYARARVQRNQSAAQLRALELQVATDVTNAALQVESSLKRYEAASSRASWRRRGFRPSRAASRSAFPPTSSSSRRSATWRPRRTPSCARCSTTAAPWWTSSACRKRRPTRRRHHGDSNRRRRR